MKDPIQGTLDAVREVEIRVGQIRLLWSEAERARESAQAEAHSLSVELARLRKETVRKDEEWRRGYEELRNRGDFELNTIRAELVRRETELGAVKDADWTLIASLRAELEQAELRSATADLYGEIRKADDVERFRARAKQDRRDRFECEASLEAAHAAIWGLGCVLTEAYADAKSARDGRNCLRRSNDRVREVLGAKPGESPAQAAERANQSLNSTKAIMSQEIERLRNDRDAALGRVVKLEKACKEGEQDVQALRESIAAVRFQRDKALARVKGLEREVASLRAPVPVEGEVRSMNVCCCSARQVARNEAAHKLFVLLHPDKKPVPDPVGLGWVVGEVARELSALRKDRETLNRVRGAVGAKS